jgi:inosine/xanthosine triphosphate pyrophosphatase family protein
LDTRNQVIVDFSILRVRALNGFSGLAQSGFAMADKLTTAKSIASAFFI